MLGERIANAFAIPEVRPGWAVSGVAYGGYNLIAAVLILPVVRHFQSRRDAVIAGALAGPLAMVPAILFFV